ncbi:MAG: restriction endonuclease, partial [Calditrichaeota bacterium]
IHQKARKEKSESELLQEQEEKGPEEFEKEKSLNLLEVLQNLTPSGFERASRELLREHGFENVVVTGRSHDGGIDGYGILELNPFVSFKVLFQCKRYKDKRAVTRAQVGDFRNAMIGRAEKGIIITTGTFTNEAMKEANRDGAPQIELVDGSKLVDMFEKVELGLQPKVVYEVDMNYFKKFMDE